MQRNESEATAVFAQRCAAIGVPMWHCDDKGRITQEPPGQTPMELVLRQRVQIAINQWLHEEEPQPIILSARTRLVPLVERQSSCRLGMSIALLDGEVLRPTHADVETMLRWSHDDLCKAGRGLRTLNQFSDQLAHAYEEINLLYDLGRSMSRITDPKVFLKQTLEELLQNLPFGWVAARFDKSYNIVPMLQDLIEIAGKAPCDPGILAAHGMELITRLRDEKKLLLLTPNDAGLASLIGSEVVAVPVIHEGQVIGALLAGNKGGDDPDVSSVETKFLQAAADFLGVYHESALRFVEQRVLFFGTVRALTASIDAKDRYTCGHSERVGFLAEQIALLTGANAEEADRYRICGLVHDVGKIGISEAVLRKPGKLTAEEFEQIKLHPGIGYEILKDIPPLLPILPGVLYHHERWDGSGYPEGLRGEAIPAIAVVIAVADVFDAMSSTRSYRPALPRTKVFAEIQRCLGLHRHPPVAELIHRCDLEAYDRMLVQHQERSLFAA